MGLGITTTGAGNRSTGQQSDFRERLIKEYNAKHPTEEFLWCPVLQSWLHRRSVVAAHLFAYKHGQSVVDAIFGEAKEPELFSPFNSILVSPFIEVFLDSGKLVIVRDLPDRLTFSTLVAWLTGDVRNLTSWTAQRTTPSETILKSLRTTPIVGVHKAECRRKGDGYPSMQEVMHTEKIENRYR